MKKYKISNIKRFISFIIMMIIIITTTVIIFANNSKEYNMVDTKSVVVSNGQSIWTIAESNNLIPEGMDIREYIHNIRELNNLGTSLIYPGQIIELPIYEIVK